MHAYALHNKPRRYVKFLLIIMLGSLIGLPMYGGDVENNRLLHLNVAHMRDRADLIVTGSLQLVGPYRESSKSFYNIMAHEVLKGSMPTNCLLVVHTDIYSYQGSDPNIEAQVPYILFLEKLNLDDKKAPPSMVCYQVSGTWKGIIPLDKKANERRAIVFIKRDYGVNILERLGDFKEAIRYSINKQKNRLTQPPEDLNPETFAIYEGLKLGELK